MIRTGRELLFGLFLVCVFSSSLAGECNITKDCCEEKLNITECSNGISTLSLSCNITKDCCEEKLNITECSNAFNAHVNSSLTSIKEGDDVTLECTHNIPALNLSYKWFQDDKHIDGNNKTNLLKKVLSSKNGKYKCFVNTSCGHCESKEFDFKVQIDSILIIIVCGVSALALVLIMGVAMKIKLEMDKAQHKERMKQRAAQRAQDAQNAGPIPFPQGY